MVGTHVSGTRGSLRSALPDRSAQPKAHGAWQKSGGSLHIAALQASEADGSHFVRKQGRGRICDRLSFGVQCRRKQPSCNAARCIALSLLIPLCHEKLEIQMTVSGTYGGDVDLAPGLAHPQVFAPRSLAPSCN